jgi:hypothetical protein
MSPEWVEEAALKWNREIGLVFHVAMSISVVEVIACDVTISIRISLRREVVV